MAAAMGALALGERALTGFSTSIASRKVDAERHLDMAPRRRAETTR